MLEQLQALEKKARAELEGLSAMEALEGWRVAFLGRKGALTEVLRSIGQAPPEQRPALGQEANRVKLALERAYTEKAEALKRAETQRQLAQEGVDVTLPGRPVAPGFLHISTQTLREIYAIFGAMGFQVFEEE